MSHKNPEGAARGTIKRAIKNLTFEQHINALVDVLKSIQLPTFAMILQEHFTPKENT